MPKTSGTRRADARLMAKLISRVACLSGSRSPQRTTEIPGNILFD
jgi:hypothetical protein